MSKKMRTTLLRIFLLLPGLAVHVFPVPIGDSSESRKGLGWRRMEGVRWGLDEQAISEIDVRDPYIKALDTFFRRLSSSTVFYKEIWEQQPRHWTSQETGVPRPKFGHANITAAADAGMLGNSGDTYFTVPQGGQLCASHRDESGLERRAGFFKINKDLALSGVNMTNKVLEQQFSAGATLSINKAGYVWRWIADICRVAMWSLGIYANVNLYATREGNSVAIPAHNDRQDVYILQLEGHKRWVLFRPVEPLPTYEQVLMCCVGLRACVRMLVRALTCLSDFCLVVCNGLCHTYTKTRSSTTSV